ncbi:hypothetical protein CRG98_027202 [Punica granatum]|uniref:Uncharacterized protein n=1 Tax=Punica granatum TaxID=22663 RepID=A0A2I0J834_PUNGR|nr:hypothetical protein CRG98_027202 [Punica granatum]
MDEDHKLSPSALNSSIAALGLLNSYGSTSSLPLIYPTSAAIIFYLSLAADVMKLDSNSRYPSTGGVESPSGLAESSH